MNALRLRLSLAQSTKYVKQSTHLGNIHEDALRECNAEPREVKQHCFLHLRFAAPESDLRPELLDNFIFKLTDNFCLV